MQITEELIRQIVQEVVERIETMRKEAELTARPSVEKFQGKVLSAPDVEFMHRQKIDRILISGRTIATPLARERANDLGIEIQKS